MESTFVDNELTPPIQTPKKPNQYWKGKRGQDANRKRGAQPPAERELSKPKVPRTGAPHGGIPEYEKSKKPIVASLVPRRNTFSVYVGTTGLPRLCRVVRDTLVTKDNQLARLLTSNLLTYVSAVCTYYRMCLIAAKTGLIIPEDISKLGKLVSDIKLPIAICNYIESFGSVLLANGSTVAPTCALNLAALMDVDTVFENMPLRQARDFDIQNADHYYFDHRTLEQLLLPGLNNDPENVPVPYDPLNNLPEGNVTAWSVNAKIIAHYRLNTRPDKVGLTFRIVNNEELSGKQEMLVSPDITAGVLTPTAPESISIVNADLGSLYVFRSSDPRTWYPSTGNYLLAGRTHIGYAIEDVEGRIAEITRASIATSSIRR